MQLAVLTAAAVAVVQAPAAPPFPPDVRDLLAGAFELAAAIGDDIWPGWAAVPFPVLLVTDSVEYYVGPADPDSTFRPLGQDATLRAPVYARARRFAPDLLATFPAVGGVPTVVVGTPAATGRAPAAWVLTLLHEHFHQFQMTRPGYFTDVEALDLSGGDQSGMWMLDYPFPYDSSAVGEAFTALQRTVRRALGGSPDRASVAAALDALYATLGARDRRYLEFQLWQEGIARYTEIAVARAAPAYAEEAERLHRELLDALAHQRLGRERRVAFYAVGAALGLLLDTSDGWHARYWREPFAIRVR